MLRKWGKVKRSEREAVIKTEEEERVYITRNAMVHKVQGEKWVHIYWLFIKGQLMAKLAHHDFKARGSKSHNSLCDGINNVEKFQIIDMHFFFDTCYYVAIHGYSSL